MRPARNPGLDARHMRRASRRHASGLTIIELTVVLIVAGVILALLVIPSMHRMVARHRVQGVQAELLGDLQFARSEQARRSGDAVPVAVSFGSNAELTCYTIHTGAPACDCTRAAGDACNGVAGSPLELKTMQFARSVGVTVTATSASGPKIVFSPPQGLVDPADLVIEVQGTTGQVRTSVNRLGVPSVCSPDGSILGVRTPC